MLLRKKANPILVNSAGLSVISITARRHDSAILKMLLQISLSTSLITEVETQVGHDVALEVGSAQLLQPMLCTGKLPLESFIATIGNLPTFDAEALLSQAIDIRSPQVVEYLVKYLGIKKGSKVAKTYVQENNETQTIDLSLNGLLFYSVMLASPALVKFFLLTLCVNPKEPCLASSSGVSILHALAFSTSIDSSEDEVMELARLLIERGADINAPNPNTRSTPLHAAVNHFKPNLMRKLVSHGANPRAKSANGHTPYLQLLVDNYSWTSIETLNTLIDLDSNMLQETFNPSDPRTNFLFVLSDGPELGRDDRISANKCQTIIEKLKNLPNGAKITKQHLEQKPPGTGYTPLHSAVTTAHHRIAKLILEAGGDVNAKAMGRTPKSLATSRDKWNMYTDAMNYADFEYVQGLDTEPLNFSTSPLVQCSRHDGWLRWQQRTQRVISLLEQRGGKEATLEDVLAEPCLDVEGFLRSLGLLQGKGLGETVG